MILDNPEYPDFFRARLIEAIEYRSQILEPTHPFLKLPIDIRAEEIIQKEQALLKQILLEYDMSPKVFLRNHDDSGDSINEGLSEVQEAQSIIRVRLEPERTIGQA